MVIDDADIEAELLDVAGLRGPATLVADELADHERDVVDRGFAEVIAEAIEHCFTGETRRLRASREPE